MRDVERAIIAASSTVNIITSLAQRSHQRTGLLLRRLTTRTRSVSMVTSVLFLLTPLPLYFPLQRLRDRMSTASYKDRQPFSPDGMRQYKKREKRVFRKP